MSLLQFSNCKASGVFLLGGINRLAGACFGIVAGAVAAGAILAVVTHLGWEGELLKGSKVALPLSVCARITFETPQATQLRVESALLRALPQIEQLVMRLPPTEPDPPGKRHAAPVLRLV